LALVIRGYPTPASSSAFLLQKGDKETCQNIDGAITFFDVNPFCSMFITIEAKTTTWYVNEIITILYFLVIFMKPLSGRIELLKIQIIILRFPYCPLQNIDVNTTSIGV
jgi:hypothetical protein